MRPVGWFSVSANSKVLSAHRFWHDGFLDDLRTREAPLKRFATIAFVALLAASTLGCRRHRFPHGRYFSSRPRIANAGVARAKPLASALPLVGAVAQVIISEPEDRATAGTDWYPWLKNSPSDRPRAATALRDQFHDPPGYQRIAVNPDTIGEWLRFLPIAPPETPVVDVYGKPAVVSIAGFVAAVVAIDLHAEESADALLRLHAEWKFSRGDRTSINYTSNSGRAIPFARWIAGERIVAKRQDWDWAFKAAPLANPTYTDLRNFLDAAYQWTDPRALAIQGKVLDASDVAPGDYFVHAGKDPTLVIVLDVAKNAAGEPALLLGHVAAPHQNMYVMRASKSSAWFAPRPDREIPAPGLRPFVWKEHHRLPRSMIGKPI